MKAGRRQTEQRLVTGVACLLLVAMDATAGAGACPGVKWKGGKQTVECRNRALITLPSNVDPQTQVMDLSGSNLQTLPREAFARANLLNLQKIYLASCRIGRIEPSAWHGLTNLVELDLSDNLLTAVPSDSLAEATSLRELRLSGNPIGKVERGAFEGAPGLVKLDLSDCGIEAIAAGAFDGLEQLAQLRLAANRLEELRPDVVASLPVRLHGFELQGNPWICDCRMRYLRHWLHAHNVPVPAAAACVLPPRLAGRALLQLQVDDFACPPHVIPPPAAPLLSGAGGAGAHLHVEAAAGENATLTCRMSGVPSPQITWLWRGRPVANGTAADDDASGDAQPKPDRAVLVIEDGDYEKTSRLVLSPARETDSGQFVCVAANAAGLARANVTLRVDGRAPVAGGLGGAGIAGLGAGLFILLAAVVAVLLLLLIRTRGARPNGAASDRSAGVGVGRGKDDRLDAAESAPASTAIPAPLKSSRSPLTEYGRVAFVSPSSPDRVVVVTGSANRPDVIHDARSCVAYSCAGGDVLAVAASAGDYHSAQTDSFYPSALWDHVLPHPSVLDEAIQQRHHQQRLTSPIHLPHVPLVDRPYGAGQLVHNPRDPDSEPESAPSIESYCLPRRIPPPASGPAASPAGGATFVPYPSDYGLPKSPPDEQEPPGPAPRATSSTSPTSSSTGYGSKVNSSSSSEPSPANSATKSPRIRTSGQRRTNRHFARDSPDEGYQDECATDV